MKLKGSKPFTILKIMFLNLITFHQLTSRPHGWFKNQDYRITLESGHLSPVNIMGSWLVKDCRITPTNKHVTLVISCILPSCHDTPPLLVQPGKSTRWQALINLDGQTDSSTCHCHHPPWVIPVQHYSLNFAQSTARSARWGCSSRPAPTYRSACCVRSVWHISKFWSSCRSPHKIPVLWWASCFTPNELTSHLKKESFWYFFLVIFCWQELNHLHSPSSNSNPVFPLCTENTTIVFRQKRKYNNRESSEDNWS